MIKKRTMKKRTMKKRTMKKRTMKIQGGNTRWGEFKKKHLNLYKDKNDKINFNYNELYNLIDRKYTSFQALEKVQDYSGLDPEVQRKIEKLESLGVSEIKRQVNFILSQKDIFNNEGKISEIFKGFYTMFTSLKTDKNEKNDRTIQELIFSFFPYAYLKWRNLDDNVRGNLLGHKIETIRFVWDLYNEYSSTSKRAKDNVESERLRNLDRVANLVSNSDELVRPDLINTFKGKIPEQKSLIKGEITRLGDTQLQAKVMVEGYSSKDNKTFYKIKISDSISREWNIEKRWSEVYELSDQLKKSPYEVQFTLPRKRPRRGEISSKELRKIFKKIIIK